jgi:hypothetical protein
LFVDLATSKMIEIILVVVAVVSLFVFSILFKTVKCHDGRIDGKNVVITGMHHFIPPLTPNVSKDLI